VLRILLVTKGLGRGGTEQLILSSAKYWDRSRFDYEVAYLLPRKADLVDALEDRQVPVHCLGSQSPAEVIKRLRRLQGQRGYDIVHVHAPHPAALARLAFRRQRPKLVYTEHGPWDRYKRPTYLANMLTYPRNDHVFAVSEYVDRSLRYPPPLSRLRMPPHRPLYHGIDPDATANRRGRAEVREQLGIEVEAPVAVCVAHFRRQKRHDVLLRAFASVKDRLPEARLVLVGGGPLEPEARQLSSQLGLDKSVVFAGYRDDALDLVAQGEVFVLSSDYEGLPIAVMEALWLAKPVIATAVGGTSEVVEHGSSGLLSPAGDPAALADVLTQVLVDEQLREALAVGATARSAVFDIRNAVATQEATYVGLAA
jgi:glycosyltransferase involved in cell wall biosynthesis